MQIHGNPFISITDFSRGEQEVPNEDAAVEKKREEARNRQTHLTKKREIARNKFVIQTDGQVVQDPETEKLFREISLLPRCPNDLTRRLNFDSEAGVIRIWSVQFCE
ncbi:hypothetical protein INT45_010367 [Circinella minor]|uniref:Uncharacterized protein n=1 Tax=Circinella minor TaxID=1195481 RepID=A0A8H7SBC9_9FUNG|nr:hypothetical protein INT45_010367 [Circinella minor]